MTDQSHNRQLRPAILAGWLYVPYEAIAGRDGLAREKRLLTYKPRFSEEDKEPMRVYNDVPEKGYLGVPRSYGINRFHWLETIDRQADGLPMGVIPKLPSPDHPRVKDPDLQRAFMVDMLEAARGIGTFRASAPTGSGKTVVSLRTAAELGRKTLVLVPLERLMLQWVKETKLHLGLPDERVGIVQGRTCQWKDRDVVIGMMHSVSLRKYSPDFYKAFGTVIYDESHRVGSSMLSETCGLFPARVRVGISATHSRKDGGDRVGAWHLGPIHVNSSATAVDCTVYVKRYKASPSAIYGKKPRARMKCLSKDHTRNIMLADLIMRNYRVGRNIMVIGKYVGHLQLLMGMCRKRGLPDDAAGQYTGRKLVYPTDALGNRIDGEPKSVKIKDAEYENILENAQVIFTTYGMFKEGLDVPRLDCGIDVIPQSESEQVTGRIRRPMEGKPAPYWITILDESCGYSKGYYDSRLRDYHKTGCNIVESRRV